MAIPIVDARRKIVGWTETIPEIRGLDLRHEQAERLVGGNIVARYIEINQASHAYKAGAPNGWEGPWRCLALCSERLIIHAADISATIRLEEARQGK